MRGLGGSIGMERAEEVGHEDHQVVAVEGIRQDDVVTP
jgi:hypothetical protein